MNRKFLSLIGIAAIVLAFQPTSLTAARSPQKTKEKLELKQLVKSGRLTPEQASELKTKAMAIRAEAKADKANGKLTRAEKLQLKAERQELRSEIQKLL